MKRNRLFYMLWPVFFAGLLSFVLSSPLFASSGGERLLKYGFITGDQSGRLLSDQPLTREHLAVIICSLHGKKTEALRFKQPPSFSDAHLFQNSWSRSYIAYCQQMGWMVGRNDGSFDPDGAVSTDELAIVLLRILGYEVKYSEASDALSKLGIRIIRSEALMRGEAFDMIWESVSKPVMANGKILGEETGLLQSDAKKFALKALRSDNLGFLAAKFNKPVDPVSVNPQCIKLVDTGSGKPIPIGSVKAVLDTVYFIPEKPFHRSTAHCVIHGISSNLSELDVMPDFEKEIRIEDKSAPNFLGFEFSGDKAITLIFDEPIAKVGTLNLKLGENINISVATTGVIGLHTDRLTFEIHSNLQSGKTYRVEAEKFKDLVGKGNSAQSHEALFVRTLQNAPTFQFGECKSSYIELIFSTHVKGIEESKFYHSSADKHPIKITKIPKFSANAVSKNEFVDRVYLWFYHSASKINHPVPSKDTLFAVADQGISDGFGTQLKGGKYTVRAENEVALPKVEYVKIEAQKVLKIGFTTEVTAPVVEVRNTSGVKLRLVPMTSSGANAGSNLYEYRLAVPVSGTLKVSVRDAKDAGDASKVIPDHIVDIHVDDRTSPMAVGAEKKVDAGKYLLLIEFSEPVDDNALLLSNYQLVIGNAVKSFAAIAVEFGNGRKSVKITLPESDYNELLAPAKEIFVRGVKDLAGNPMVGTKIRFSGAKETNR